MMKQKLLTLFLALAASVGVLFAQSGTCGDYLTWDLTEGVLTISGTGAMTDYDYYTPDYLFGSGRNSIYSVIIKDGVTSIGNSAFSDCSNLTSVTIGSSVTSIGNSAFSGCSNLTSVTIPSSVTSIGDYAFSGCKINKIDFNGTIEDWCNKSWRHIGLLQINTTTPLYTPFSLYLNGTILTDLVIPSSVTSIGRSAFEFCSNLTSVTIGNSVTSIGWNAFLACSNLISVTLPNSVTSIGQYTFYGCTSLTSITIPNSVTSIGNYAFQNCSSLTSVTIGNSVTSIGDFAFTNCSGLTSITSEAVTPAVCQEYTFYDVDKSIPLYVPYSSVEAYKAADGWKEFFNIQPITSAPTAIEEMQSSEELKGTPRKVLIDGQLYILNGGNTYNLQGMEVK